MALEAVVFQQDPFSTYGCKDCFSLGGGDWRYDIDLQEQDKSFYGILDQDIEQSVYANWDPSSPSLIQNVNKWDHPTCSPKASTGVQSHINLPGGFPHHEETTTKGRRKRRRTRSCKNKEEAENQRMTHIAVERNRRKQMNEYLAVLRSLMPSSYVPRGDQASIIGGAINFIKVLEQLLQSQAQNKAKQQQQLHDNNDSLIFANPFLDFFAFPQYSTRGGAAASHDQCNNLPAADKNRWAIADIEVTMVETHANLKILSKRRPKQLLKIVAGFQSLRLSILHLNVVTTDDHMVLYSISVKVEDGCQLTNVDEIATAVNQMLGTIDEESRLFS